MRSLRVWLAVVVSLTSIVTPRANVVGPAPIGELDPTAPVLPPGATDEQKVLFAERSLDWALKNKPAGSFQPPPEGLFAPVEWQLTEALANLDTIKDTAEDKMLAEHDEHLKEIVWDVISDTAEDVAKGDAEGVMEDIIKKTLIPSVAGDGPSVAPVRDALRGAIMQQMVSYQQRRTVREIFPPDGTRPNSIPPAPQPGPTIESVHKPISDEDRASLLRIYNQAESVRQSMIATDKRNAAIQEARGAQYAKQLPALILNLNQANWVLNHPSPRPSGDSLGPAGTQPNMGDPGIGIRAPSNGSDSGYNSSGGTADQVNQTFYFLVPNRD